MLTGITHCALTVKDMEKSKDFFCRVLGFRQAFEINKPETGEPWIVYLHAGGGQFVELFYNGSKDTVWEPGMRGFNHICFSVEDIHRFAQHIKDQGGILDVQPKMGADHNWQCWITDPDGVRIEIMQISPESPHARALAMYKEGAQ